MQHDFSNLDSLSNSDLNQGQIGVRKISVKTRSTQRFKKADLENLINEANNVMDELKELNHANRIDEDNLLSDLNAEDLPQFNHLDEDSYMRKVTLIKDKGDKEEKYFDMKKEKLVNKIRRISVVKFKNGTKR